MQPCGGDGEPVGAAMLQPQVVQPTPGVASEAAPSAQSSFMVFCDLVPAAEVEGEGGAGEGSGGGGSPGGGGLEDLDDEDESGAQSGGGGGDGCKSCTYQGCSETTTQVAKQRKPWMCKRHRNKMYKDKYKRKKSDQALGTGGAAGGGGGGSSAGGGGGGGGGIPASVAPGAAQSGGNVPGSGGRVEDCTEGSISVSKQRTGNIGDRPAKPTLLEQVLNHKRQSLLRSPEVVHFLQKRQQLLSQQAMEQRQQHFSGASV
uniref:Regulatory factor X-associated protein n=1 Tax=Pogona vitticeps TaxID=103695 RepID=A0A6J0SWS1_9SAUR